MRSLILIFSFVFFSCGHESKTIPSSHAESNLPVDESKKINPAQTNSNRTDGDPTFELTQDTITKYGPHSITRNVLQDKNGNIWLATWQGIIRYDGNLFTNVTLKEGLRQFHVFSLLEDKSGNLWFGTIGGGVYRYDGKSYTNFTTQDGLADNTVLCMLAERDGNIWFGTKEGVSRYKDNSFTNFTKGDGLSANFVNCIAQDKTGKLWFGTRGGVSCYFPSVSTLPLAGQTAFTNFTINKELSFHGVHSLLEDRAGNIWIGSDEGLHRFYGKSLTNIFKNGVFQILQDYSGDLWISSGEVKSSNMILYRYDGKSFFKIKEERQVFGIAEDKGGNIWFGTANGVCRYDRQGKTFTKFGENEAVQ